MTILSSELKFYKSKTVTDDSTNGGRMSVNEAVSGVVQNVFPHVMKAERDAGSTKYRKVFAKVANDADETLLAGKLWFDKITPADDWAVFFDATQRNTQGDITGAEDIFGCGALNTDVTAGGSTLIVDVEDSTLVGMFRDTETIRITDMDNPDSITGNEEFLTISGAPSVSGTQVTVTVAETLANDYTTANNTRVMPVYEVGDIFCELDNWVETSASGTYDEGAFPPVTDNIGTIEQSVTLTFTDSTNFTATSDVSGVSLGSGTTGGDFTPSNPDYTKPYFTVESGGWGGTWAAGDTITFDTHPAAVPLWEKRVVPAGAASLSNNKIILVFSGESA